MAAAVLEPLMCYESIRLGVSVPPRIEAHRRRLAAAHPGVVVTVNSAVRNLLMLALHSGARHAVTAFPPTRECLTRYKRIRLSNDLREKIDTYLADVRALQDETDGELTKDAVLRHLIGLGLRQAEQRSM